MWLSRRQRLELVRQSYSMDCGPTCLNMIAKYYGKNYSLESLRILCAVSKLGTSLLGLSKGAESIGIKNLAVRISYDYLESKVILPCIAYWKNSHFVVIYKIKKDSVYVADPVLGLTRYSKKEFMKNWADNKVVTEEQGICLLVSPSANYFKKRTILETDSIKYPSHISNTF